MKKGQVKRLGGRGPVERARFAANPSDVNA